MNTDLKKIFKLQLIFAIVVLWLVYSFIYNFIDQKEFIGMSKPIDPYYFSMTTLATVGYGDIVPASTKAKMLVMSQQFFSIIIMSCLLIF